MAEEDLEIDKIKGLAEAYWRWKKAAYDPIWEQNNKEKYLKAFLDGYVCGREDGLIEATEDADKLMLFGEIPPHNIKTIDRYMISC